MNEEIRRFFNSIGFNGEGFNEAVIEKVILKKKEEKFYVYIKNKDVIDLEYVNQLFLCGCNGINGSKKCNIILNYENVTF